jgi:predicted transposase YdaD
MRESVIYQDILEEGREEGEEKGLQKGRQEGLQEGKEEKARQIALKMLYAGFPGNSDGGCQHRRPRVS